MQHARGIAELDEDEDEDEEDVLDVLELERELDTALLELEDTVALELCELAAQRKNPSVMHSLYVSYSPGSLCAEAQLGAPSVSQLVRIYRTLDTLEELDELPPPHVAGIVQSGAPSNPNEMNWSNGEPPVHTAGHCELDDPAVTEDPADPTDDPMGVDETDDPAEDDSADELPGRIDTVDDPPLDADEPELGPVEHTWHTPPVQHSFPATAHCASLTHALPRLMHMPFEQYPLQQSPPAPQPPPSGTQVEGKQRYSVPDNWHESGFGCEQHPLGFCTQFSPNPRHDDELLDVELCGGKHRYVLPMGWHDNCCASTQQC